MRIAILLESFFSSLAARAGVAARTANDVATSCMEFQAPEHWRRWIRELEPRLQPGGLIRAYLDEESVASAVARYPKDSLSSFCRRRRRGRCAARAVAQLVQGPLSVRDAQLPRT